MSKRRARRPKGTDAFYRNLKHRDDGTARRIKTMQRRDRERLARAFRGEPNAIER